MNIGKYIVFFLLSTFKFLVTPFGGPPAKLTFLETYISCVSGGILSAVVFYFSADFFIKKAKLKRLKLIKETKERGLYLVEKKKFTTFNKFIVKTKKKLGIFGISFYAPLFFSVPIGSIVAAKFYGKDKRTFPLILLGMFVNGLLTTGLSYFIFSFFNL
jgi:hypothetical protein